MNDMVKIWLNHWFSTAYSIIDLMKRNEPEFYIVGSNEVPDAVYSLVCDEWHCEPVMNDDEYIEYCFDFCDKNRIDVFIPRRKLIAVSRNKKRFEDMNVKVMVDDYELISMLNQKTKAYEYFSEHKKLNIPEYRTVRNSIEFAEAYRDLSDKYQKICFKFAQDEGGMSFRIIDNTKKGYNALFRYRGAGMTFDEAFSALSEKETFPEMIVMPYLAGYEVSADCLSTPSGLIIIPRIKGNTRIEKVEFDEEILNMCRDFHRLCPLEMPFNLQFRYLDGVPYFLEANTRMSGGIQMSCLACDVNIPNIAVNKLLGIERKWKTDKNIKKISHVEVPVIVR